MSVTTTQRSSYGTITHSPPNVPGSTAHSRCCNEARKSAACYLTTAFVFTGVTVGFAVTALHAGNPPYEDGSEWAQASFGLVGAAMSGLLTLACTALGVKELGEPGDGD